jgi:hypothetical protein
LDVPLFQLSQSERRTGNAIIIVSRERFFWSSGQDHRVTYQLRPTYSITRCKTCGTPLPAEEDEKNVYLTAGTLTTRLVWHQDAHLLRIPRRLGSRHGGRALLRRPLLSALTVRSSV